MLHLCILPFSANIHFYHNHMLDFNYSYCLQNSIFWREHILENMKSFRKIFSLNNNSLNLKTYLLQCLHPNGAGISGGLAITAFCKQSVWHIKGI